MCPHPANTIRSNAIQPIQSSRYDTIQRYDPANTIQSSRQSNKADNTIQKPRPILSCLTASASRFYTTYPADAPSSDFPPSPAASTARYFLSSSAAASSSAFFYSDLDSAISKADFLAFLIASPTGQSLEEIRKCLMEPHRHRFC